MRLISENVCFTVVKHYFLRSGRVQIRDFFMSCFRSKIVGTFLVKFFGFVGFQGPHRVPNWSLLGTLRGTLAQKGEFDSAPVPRWPPGSKKESFGGGSGLYFGVI